MQHLDTMWRGHAAALVSALLLAACASAPTQRDDVATSPWAAQSSVPHGRQPLPWTHQTFPGKTPSTFGYARVDGRDTVLARAHGSASMLRQVMRVEPEQLGRVRFSWKVPALIPAADIGSPHDSDAPVRIVLAFEGDRSRFTPRDAALAELVRALTGEEMPYATLMYVWCNRREPDSVVRHARTNRIRKLVVQGGTAGLNEWQEYERDVRADYERVFGEKPGALIGIGIMTDSDNTRSSAQAWYGPVQLLPPALSTKR